MVGVDKELDNKIVDGTAFVGHTEALVDELVWKIVQKKQY